MADLKVIQTTNSSRWSIPESSPNTFSQNLAEKKIRSQKELRSLSHLDTNNIFTNKSGSNAQEGQINRISNSLDNKVELATNTYIKKTHRQLNLELITFNKCKSIDKAQQYFAASGILGPTNLSHSRELIKETSKIHLDSSLKNNIRKTSLGLRLKAYEEQFPSNISAQNSIPTTYQKASNELILRNIQKQVYNLKEIIETGETKIIMLRAEVNKIKRLLEEMMYENAITENSLFYFENPYVCVFCQK